MISRSSLAKIAAASTPSLSQDVISLPEIEAGFTQFSPVLQAQVAGASLSCGVDRLDRGRSRCVDGRGLRLPAAPDPESATVWLEDLWRSHLAGVFGVCVRQPDRVDQIVRKETLQVILAERTDNGARADYGAEEAALIRDVVDRYAAACADFTPVEYPISSRRRYLEGLRLPPAR